MRTKEEYIESLRRMKPNIYLLGEKVESVVDHPMINPAVNSTAGTFEMAQNPKTRDLMTIKSPLIGKDINIWTNIDASAEHAMRRHKSLRIGIPKYTCFIRCMSLCVINPLWAATYECDQEHNTHYHERLVEYTKHVQETDVMVAGALTDATGDRSLRPSQQPDPDMYVRVVEKRKDGIIVKGAKLNITAPAVSNEMVVMPHTALHEEDKDFVVAFAVPIDAPGLTIIPRPTGHARPTEIDYPVSQKYGQVECHCFFDNVFIPWERVFLCGEWDMSARLIPINTRIERHLVAGCAAGKADLKIGAAALAAEYSGIDNMAPVRERLLKMVEVAEILNALGISSAYEGERHPSGLFMPAALPANLIKHYAASTSSALSDHCMDIGGAIVSSIPTEADIKNPVTKPLIEKYLKTKAGVPVEDRIRAIKLLEDLTVTPFAGWYIIMDLLGGGSSAAAKVGMRRAVDWEKWKKVAKIQAGINKTEDVIDVLA